MHAHRRLGAVFLFALWAQVATANALPCGLSCYMGEKDQPIAGMIMPEDHVVGHHMSGPRISTVEECGTPQLLVLAAVPADFPLPPLVHVAVYDADRSAVPAFISAVPEFSTPPPRA